jgi:hypothetical protein
MLAVRIAASALGIGRSAMSWDSDYSKGYNNPSHFYVPSGVDNADAFRAGVAASDRQKASQTWAGDCVAGMFGGDSHTSSDGISAPTTFSAFSSTASRRSTGDDGVPAGDSIWSVVGGLVVIIGIVAVVFGGGTSKEQASGQTPSYSQSSTRTPLYAVNYAEKYYPRLPRAGAGDFGMVQPGERILLIGRTNQGLCIVRFPDMPERGQNFMNCSTLVNRRV